MLRKVGELQVDRQLDYYEKQKEALEKSGFVLILTHQTFGTSYYNIACEKNILYDGEKEGEKNG